jgi:hypothetical protein
MHLAHLMIMIAATAIGLVGVKNCYIQMPSPQIFMVDVTDWVSVCSPMLLAIAAGLIVAGIVPRRRRLSELCRTPGFTASWAAMLVLAFEVVTKFAVKDPPSSYMAFLLECFNYDSSQYMVEQVGFGVSIAWTTLAMARSWRAEPTWLDRSGRVLGGIWILTFAVIRLRLLQ